MEIILLDTNILIEIFKGNSSIVSYLSKIDKTFAISSITQMELFYGAFNKKEIKTLDNFMKNFHIYHLTPSISSTAVDLIKIYAKSHNLTLPDALIAATAIVKNVPLFTPNLKDFKYISQIKLLKH